MHLTVLAFHWEGSTAKVLCRSDGGEPDVNHRPSTTPEDQDPPAPQPPTNPPQPPPPPPQRRRQPPRDVVLILQNKASHALDLSAGRRLVVHGPWQEVALPGAGAAAAVLAHLVAQSGEQQELTQWC